MQVLGEAPTSWAPRLKQIGSREGLRQLGGDPLLSLLAAIKILRQPVSNAPPHGQHSFSRLRLGKAFGSDSPVDDLRNNTPTASHETFQSRKTAVVFQATDGGCAMARGRRWCSCLALLLLLYKVESCSSTTCGDEQRRSDRGDDSFVAVAMIFPPWQSSVARLPDEGAPSNSLAGQYGGGARQARLQGSGAPWGLQSGGGIAAQAVCNTTVV